MAGSRTRLSKGQAFTALAIVASETPRAQDAAAILAKTADWVPLEQADAVVVLGGDGFMLQILHQMLDMGRVIPAYGLNLGTVGFLMNGFKNGRKLLERIDKSRLIAVNPLRVEASTHAGETITCCAINEVSLLRETRQTAKIEVAVNGRVRIPELVLRWSAARNSCRIDGLQPFRERSDPAARFEHLGPDADQSLPPPPMERRNST